MRVGLRLVDHEAHEVIGFVDFDLRGKDLAEYNADPDKWLNETHDVLVAYMKARHKTDPPPAAADQEVNKAR